MNKKMKYVLGVITDGRNFLVIRKTKPEWQNGKSNFPGGKMEEGETPIYALIREIKEETDIDSNPIDWVAIASAKNKSFDMYVFAWHTDRATLLKARTMTEEEIVLMHVSDMLFENLLPSARMFAMMAIDPAHVYSEITYSDIVD